jgi:hypothetical protein
MPDAMDHADVPARAVADRQPMARRHVYRNSFARDEFIESSWNEGEG